MSENCKPKIIRWFIESNNDNVEYNCEKCDDVDCEYWKEWHNDNEL